jgi:hypothetical protein
VLSSSHVIPEKNEKLLLSSCPCVRV